MKFKRLFLASICCLVSTVASAQYTYLSSRSDAEELSVQVVQRFSKNEISAAFELLAAHWPLPVNEIEAIEEKSIKYLNMLSERFGKSIGHMKLGEETIGDVAFRETWLVRHEHSAIRLKFTYYKGTEGWIVNAFKWDDDWTEELR